VIILIHLLEHLGLPSGAAIALVIAARKLVKGGISRSGIGQDRGRRPSGHDR
jgi:hypothetical protein